MPNASIREQARTLCWQAEDADSELEKVNLAREAQKLWEDCPDAHLILGKVTGDPHSARDHFQRSLSAAYELIGEDELDEWEGELAHHEHGLSYLRALDSLALVAMYFETETDESSEDAAIYLRLMLKLDVYDHLGAAHTFLGYLIEKCEHKADEEALQLIVDHPCECPQYLYSEALLAYRLELDEEGASQRLEEAILTEPYVPAFLLGAMELPEEPPDPEGLGEDEMSAAAAYAVSSLQAWRDTEGALEWLRSGVMRAFEEISEDLVERAMLDSIFAGEEPEEETDTIRVLIADSEPVRQLGIRLALESAGRLWPGAIDPFQPQTGKGQSYSPAFEVHAIAPDAGSAFSAAADLDFDVAIVDVIMRMDATMVDTKEFNGVIIPGGFTLAYNLKHGREDLGVEPMKVLLLGEYEDDEEPAHQLRYTGADGYVDARVSVAKLVAAVRGVCAGEEVKQGL